MKVDTEEIVHFLSTNRSAMLNQGNSATQGKYGQSAALFSMGIIRRNCAGLGFKNKVIARQNLALAENWSSTGYNSNFCQLFTWNAGNLDRQALMDAVNNTICQPFTIGMTQEASTGCVQMKLYDARGIAVSASSDKSIMCSSGGTGTKMICRIYDDPDNPYQDWIPRPAFYEKPVPVFDHHRLLDLEDAELLIRIQLGTSYGRTGLNKDRLNRVLENELWYQVPSGKFKGSSSKGKGESKT